MRHQWVIEKTSTEAGMHKEDCVMKDYFFDFVEARSELAASKVSLENLVLAIEKELPETRETLMDVYLKLAKEQVVVIKKLLEKEVA